MTYRDMMIETIKIACNDTIERVEDIVPNTEGLTNVDVVIHIPSLTDDAAVIPTVKIVTDSYVKPAAVEKIYEMLQKYIWKGDV